jgi:predicted chitinase
VHKKAEAGGNTQLGDGPRFCGRGLLHRTWRNGYRDYGKFRARDFTTGLNPDLLQSDAQIAADSAGYYWAMRRIDSCADKGATDSDVKACFRKVGGVDGLPERQELFHYAY